MVISKKQLAANALNVHKSIRPKDTILSKLNALKQRR
jgi:hypothetical protein